MGVVCRFCGKSVGMVGAVPRSANRRAAPKAVKVPMPSQPSWNTPAFANGDTTYAQHLGQKLYDWMKQYGHLLGVVTPDFIQQRLIAAWPQGPYQMILAAAPATYETQLQSAAQFPWPELLEAIYYKLPVEIYSRSDVGATPRSANPRRAPKAVKAPMPSQPSWNGEAYNGVTWLQHWMNLTRTWMHNHPKYTSYEVPGYNRSDRFVKYWPQGPYEMVQDIAPSTQDTQLHEAALNPWPELQETISLLMYGLLIHV